MGAGGKPDSSMATMMESDTLFKHSILSSSVLITTTIELKNRWLVDLKMENRALVNERLSKV